MKYLPMNLWGYENYSLTFMRVWYFVENNYGSENNFRNSGIRGPKWPKDEVVIMGSETFFYDQMGVSKVFLLLLYLSHALTVPGLCTWRTSNSKENVRSSSDIIVYNLVIFDIFFPLFGARRLAGTVRMFHKRQKVFLNAWIHKLLSICYPGRQISFYLFCL